MLFSKETYMQRRQTLKKRLGSGLVLLFGNNDSPANYPSNVYRFRQDSSFLYFYGQHREGLVGVIDIDEDQEYLIGDDISIEDIVWFGQVDSVADIACQCGVPNTAPMKALQEMVSKAKQKGQRIHFLPPYRHDIMIQIMDLTGIHPREQRAQASLELIMAVIDFALMIEPFNVEQYHFIRLPETMRVGIVTRDDSKWAQKSGITPDDLNAMPLLVSSRQSLNRYDYRQWSGGKVSAETMNIVGKFDLISNVSHFIRTGIANAIGIDELLQLDTGHLKFIPLEPALTLSAVIVWKKYRLLSKSSSVFLEELKQRVNGEFSKDKLNR